MGRKARSSETLGQRLLQIEGVVLDWWKNKRPNGWPDEEHELHFQVNTTGVSERELARTAAEISKRNRTGERQ